MSASPPAARFARRLAFVLAAVALAASAFVGPAAARAAEPTEFVSAVEKAGGPTMTGELVAEDERYLELRDLTTGAVRKFIKAELKTVRRNVAERTVVDAVGLPNFIAAKVGAVLPVAAAAKVALVEGAPVYVTLGKASGVEPGAELKVYRGDVEIKDPDTGKVLGRRRTEVGKLKIATVEDALAQAAVVGDAKSPIQVGDLVEAAAENRAVAVLPLVNAEGKETVETKRLADELTNGLVNRGVSVVERRLLDKVLGELNLQQTAAFDPAQAQAVGKQLGVYAIVFGTIAPKGKFAEAQFRVVRVATGEILAATSHRLAGEALTGVVRTAIPAEAVKFGGHSYLLHFDVLSWSDAKKKCEALGGHLVTPETAEENAFVVQLAQKSGRRFEANAAIWIGATDEAKEGDWRFVDGSAIKTPFWLTGLGAVGDQPNNKQGVEHYAAIILSSGRWCDQPNASRQHTMYFVCEWDQD